MKDPGIKRMKLGPYARHTVSKNSPYHFPISTITSFCCMRGCM